MAINTQKLLPSAKTGGALAKVSKKVINTDSFSNFGSPKISKDIGIIKIKVIEIEDILKGTVAAEKKALDEKKRLESSKRREKQEEKLETKKQPEKGAIKTPKVPRMGFLDWIKNFIGNVLLGYFVVRMIDFLPKIKPIIGFIGSATDFVIDVGGKLLNGLVSFIDWGYKAIDFTKGMMKNLGGKGAEKAFEGFMGSIGNLVETAIIAAAVIGSMGDGGSEMGTTGIRGVAGQAGRSRYGTSAAAARRYAERYGVDAARKKFGSEAVKSLGGRYARSGITNLARKGLVGVLGKGGAKAALKVIKPILGNLPVIGGLLEFAISWATGDPVGKAAFRGIGAGLVGAVGTAIGGPIGLAIGGFVGGEIGGVLYDIFFGGKKPQQKNQKIQKKAGGGITRGGKAQTGARRSIGGDKKKGKYKRILAKNPDKTQFKTDPKDPLVKSGKELDKTKYFGPVLAVATKLEAKEEPTQKDYDNVGLGLNLLIAKGLEEGQLKGGLVAAFAEGGMVDDKFLEAAEKGVDVSSWISKTFKNELETNAQRTLRLIKERKRQEEKHPSQTTPEGIPLGEGETASGRALMQGLIQRGFTKEEASAIVGNLWAESGFRTTATNPSSGAFGLMQWLGGRKSRLYSYAAEQGKQVSDVNLQLDYIKWELKGGNAYETEQFKKAMAYGPDVASKTKGFAEQVERAGAGELRSSMSKRIGAAESVYGGKMVAGEKPSVGPLGTGKASSVDQFNAIAKKYGLSLTSSYRSGDSGYHGKNRARDYSNDSVGRGTPEQLAFAKYLVENYGSSLTQLIYTPLGFGIANGKKVGLDYWGASTNAIHYHHVHVALAKGGRIKKPTYAIIGEKGPEFVFDADTTAGLDRLAPGILEKLNVAKTKPQLASILQSYAGYEQPYAEPEIVEVPVEIPVPIPMGDGSSGGVSFVPFGGGDDPFENLYKGG